MEVHGVGWWVTLKRTRWYGLRSASGGAGRALHKFPPYSARRTDPRRVRRWRPGRGAGRAPPWSRTMSCALSPAQSAQSARDEKVYRATQRTHRIVPRCLPNNHIAAAPRRKLTSGSCSARLSSALRVTRPAVVSVETVRASGTFSVRITTSKEVRSG